MIITGIGAPFSRSFVLSLNALQKSIILRPLCPSAGPTGGEGLAPPAGICNLINDKTKDLEKGAPIPVIITAYKDRSFDFTTKLPPVSFYLKKAAKIKKGNSTPGRSFVGKVSMQDIEKIAKEKMQDLNAIDINGAINMVKGSALSMGMEVVG